MNKEDINQKIDNQMIKLIISNIREVLLNISSQRHQVFILNNDNIRLAAEQFLIEYKNSNSFTEDLSNYLIAIHDMSIGELEIKTKVNSFLFANYIIISTDQFQ